MNGFGRADISAVRLWCFLTALGVYALAGSPTPDHPGLAEIAIAVLLIAAAGAGGALRVLRAGPAAGRALLVYGLSAVLVIGALRGHEAGLMLRDGAAFLFLLLPLFLMGLGEARAERRIFIAVALVGFIFALRGLAAFSVDIAALLPEVFTQKQELTYFANAPTVLFAALFIFGTSGQKFMREFSLRAALLFMGGAVLALITLLPVMLTMQRASLGYAAVYVAALSALALFYYPRRTAAVLLIAAALSFPLWGVVAEIVNALTHKTALVGFNARGAELAAVWREISGLPGGLLFGTGWGGTFESPAVANIRVNYTHSLLSSMLLKTGIAGLILTILYIGEILAGLMGRARAYPVLVLALLGPILIDTFLYASFKSLDFGLILLLAGLAEKLHKPAACCIQENINQTHI